MENLFSDLLKFAISLYSVLNPLGAIPIFLSLTQSNSNEEIKKVASSCAIAVSITIMVSLVLGRSILGFFGISVASFRVGGGLLVGIMAFQMLYAKSNEAKLNTDEIQTHKQTQDIGIVPLGIPLLAGPGSISTSIIHADEFHSTFHWIGAMVIVALIGLSINYILTFGRVIGGKVGKVGLNVTTRIMGLILMALAVEFVASGLKDIFPSL